MRLPIPPGSAVLLCALLPSVVTVAETGQSARSPIAVLEAELFEPKLSTTELDRLLELLTDEETRPAAAGKLQNQAQGMQDRIIAFAHRCRDLEARQACAEIIEALDASYRTTELGQKLAKLYRQHAASLLPTYWARFRQNALGPRAVAMLMAADPEETYTWLGSSRDRRDRIRYLLLRIRELGRDDFAQKRIREHTVAGTRLAARDIYPCDGGFFSFARSPVRVHRIVGHVFLNVLHVYSRWPAEGHVLPMVSSVSNTRRWVFLFRSTTASGAWYLYLSDKGHSPGRPSDWTRRGSPTWGHMGRVHGVCPLPELKLTRRRGLAWHNDRAVAWWARPYIPRVYQQHMTFSERPANETPPEDMTPRIEPPVAGIRPKAISRPFASLDPFAPSVVVLPPVLSVEASDAVRHSAEMACDRLAQELAEVGVARVVDRTQLDRVLAERAMSPKVSGPILSYDAMVRLEVVTARPPPQTRLSLIEVSTGNVMAAITVGWPVQEADLEPMLSACRRALAKTGRPAPLQLRVRILGQVDRKMRDRLKLLAGRLDRTFEAALPRLDGVQVVRHLEARSNKEESLLLLLGMSRLPGGRLFEPAADAVVRWWVSEGDGSGKTFEETPVVIGTRIDTGERQEGPPALTQGSVRGFEDVTQRAWSKLAEELSHVRRSKAVEVRAEMATRRQQAKAELEAGPDIGADRIHLCTAVHGLRLGRPTPKDQDKRLSYRQKCIERLAHTEAALKIDPTYEEAAYEHIVALTRLILTYGGEKNVPRESVDRLIAEIIRYCQRFGGNAAHRSAVAHAAYVTISLPPVLHVLQNRGIRLTPELRRTLDQLKVLTESLLVNEVLTPAYDVDELMATTYRGMRLAGVSLSERQRWADTLPYLSQERADGTHRGVNERYARRAKLDQRLHLRIRASELAIEDGQLGRAKGLLIQAMDEHNPHWFSNHVRRHWMSSVVARLDDAEVVAGFREWSAAGDRPERLRWPEIDVFPVYKKRIDGRLRKVAPRLRTTVLPCSGPKPESTDHVVVTYSLLAESPHRLYVALTEHRCAKGEIVSRSQRVGYVPLDAWRMKHGIEAETAGHTDADQPDEDGLQFLPQPDVDGRLMTACAKLAHGKLYLGTVQSGLLVFDPTTESWEQFGPKMGVPSNRVNSIHSLTEDRLLCSGPGGAYELDIKARRVRMLHASRHPRHPNPLVHMWRHDQHLWGWCPSGLWKGLKSRSPIFTPLPDQSIQGWLVARHRGGKIVDIATTGGRSFYIRQLGLFEFDTKGGTIQAWSARWEFWQGGTRILLYPDAPITGWPTLMIAVGETLVIAFEGHRENLVAYEPETDTWYGPVYEHGVYELLPSSSGFWIGGSIRFVQMSDFVAAARQCGRVMTTEQYRRRVKQAMEDAPVLDRAKFAFAIRQFTHARKLVEQVLQDDPENTQALRLSTLLNNPAWTDQPIRSVGR